MTLFYLKPNHLLEFKKITPGRSARPGEGQVSIRCQPVKASEFLQPDAEPSIVISHSLLKLSVRRGEDNRIPPLIQRKNRTL
jgi:hypothetical protein